MKRRFLIFLAYLAFLMVSAGVLMGVFGYDLVHRWIEGEGFRRLLSHEVSKSMKMDGEFDPPFVLKGWTLTTPAYSGTGWPGEAMGSLDAQDIKGVFDPWGILRRQWLVKRIDIGKGRFVLKEPDDAKKRHPVKKAPPWYAIFMPSRFYCEWIETPYADVEFAFVGKDGGLRGVHLGATMIERDFKYFVDGGTAELPLMPVLGVDWLVIYVTKEKADIEQAYLRGLNGDPARVELSGRLGQRKDKSIRADVKVEQLPFAQALPEEMRDLVTGRINGTCQWSTDITGKKNTATGEFALIGTQIKAWPWLEEMARLRKNPDLLNYDLAEASCRFLYDGDRFELEDIKLHAIDKARVQGRAAYDWKTKRGEFDVDLDEIPISAWLPEEMKPRINANLRGHLRWKGSVKQLADSEAAGNFILDGTEIRNPVRLQKLLGTYSARIPDYIHFERARMDFDYANQLFFARKIDLHAPDVVDLNGSATWTHQNYIQLNLAFDFKKLEAWLPKKLDKHVSGGDLSGRIDWSCQDGKISSGNGNGNLILKGSVLTGMKLQKTMCRFLKTDDYLTLPLADAQIDWENFQTKFILRRIDILSPGKIGVGGTVTIAADQKISGVLKVGLPLRSLEWLPEATTAVFTEKREGLYWATIALSGTTKEPKQDFTAQVMRVMERHPIALIGLAMRGLSWWLGDVFGTYEPPA